MISDIDLEKSIIGTVIMDIESLYEIGAMLKPEYFVSPRHRVIWNAILNLEPDKIDRLSISMKLSEFGQLEIAGGDEYLHELILHGEKSTKILNRAEILANMAWTNQAEIFFEKYHTQIKSKAKPINEIMESAQGDMADLLQFGVQVEIKPIGDVAEKIYQNIVEQASKPKTERKTGITSGYGSLDRALGGGFKDTDLVILAGRPAMGKSVVAQNIAANSKVPVLLFTLEMSAEQVTERILAGDSKTSLNTIRNVDFKDENDDRIERIHGKVKKMKNRELYIVDSDDMTPLKIKAIARNAVRKYGVKLIIVDYIQIVKINSNHKSERFQSREQEINYIVTSLKSLAMELKLPVIALAQVGRQAETRQDKRPILADLRESGSIENTADIVIFIYRDEVYNEKTKFKDLVELIFAKFRNGDSSATVILKFFKEYQRIVEFAPKQQEN